MTKFDERDENEDDIKDEYDKEEISKDL